MRVTKFLSEYLGEGCLYLQNICIMSWFNSKQRMGYGSFSFKIRWQYMYLFILVIKNTCYLTVTLLLTFGMNKLGGHKIWPVQLVICKDWWDERLMTSAKNVCSYFLTEFTNKINVNKKIRNHGTMFKCEKLWMIHPTTWQ